MIKNYWIYILITIFYFSFSALNATAYKTHLIEKEITSDVRFYNVIGINDKGQLYGWLNENNISKTFISNPKTGINILDIKGSNIQPIKFNNVGQFIGRSSNKLFMWSKVFGIRYLDSIVNAVDLNDLGQIIGKNDQGHACIWDYGDVIDMGPSSEFGLKFEALGYYVMDIHLTSINKKGELAGYFEFGKFNKKKQKYVIVGKEAFFWDGELHILLLPNAAKSRPEIIKLNNHGQVMVTDSGNSTYLWSHDKGLFPIIDFIGKNINDSKIILGDKLVYSENNFVDIVPAIWKNNTIITIAELLGINNISEISEPYGDTYAIESLDSISGINNLGQIACMGALWGDKYPCILEPVNYNNNLDDENLISSKHIQSAKQNHQTFNNFIHRVEQLKNPKILNTIDELKKKFKSEFIGYVKNLPYESQKIMNGHFNSMMELNNHQSLTSEMKAKVISDCESILENYK